MVHLVSHFPSASRDTYGPTMICLTWSGPPPACSNWSGPPPNCSNLSGLSVSFSPYSRPFHLSLTATALAQLSSVTVVAVAATDVHALTALSVVVVAAVLARDDPPLPSAGLISVICPTQRQCLCLRHIFLHLGWLEGVFQWLHGRRWPQDALSQKRGTIRSFNF